MIRFKNFTERAVAWAAEHPEAGVSYADDVVHSACDYDYYGVPGKYTAVYGPHKVLLIKVIEDWEESQKYLGRELDMTPLHRDFDLIYDLKYMYEVEMVCDGKSPAGTDATPEELLEMFNEHNMKVPKFLADAVGNSAVRRTIWIGIDGSWLSYQPLPDEIHNYAAAKVTFTQEFIKSMEARNGK